MHCIRTHSDSKENHQDPTTKISEECKLTASQGDRPLMNKGKKVFPLINFLRNTNSNSIRNTILWIKCQGFRNSPLFC